MTQPLGTLSAKPAGVHSAVLGHPALGAITSSSLSRSGVVIDFYGKVPKRKGTDIG